MPNTQNKLKMCQTLVKKAKELQGAEAWQMISISEGEVEGEEGDEIYTVSKGSTNPTVNKVGSSTLVGGSTYTVEVYLPL